MLAVAGGARAVASRLVVAAEHVQKVRVAQTGGAAGLAFLVDQEGERNASILPELARVVCVAESDGCQVGAPLAEGLLVFAQLRDMLAAEDSTVVAQEDHHGRLPLPKRAEPDLAAVRIGQHDRRKRFGEHLRKCTPSAPRRNPSSAGTGSYYRDAARRPAVRRCRRIDRPPPCGSPRRGPASACATRCPASAG